MIKKWSIVIFLPLFLILPNAWAQVSIINDQQYVGEDGVFHIVGEIQNDSSVPLNQIVITATFYSTDGQTLGIKSIESILETILPAKKGPFDLIFFDKDVSLIDHYSLDVKFKPTDYKTESLEIVSAQDRRDVVDNFIISGTVANHDYRTANTVVVIATLYDGDGKVVAAAKAYTEPQYLRGGEEAPFLVSVTDKSQSRKATDYLLTVESEEYTVVPEFPLGSGTILVLSVFSYLLFTKKPTVITTSLARVMNLK